jgi:hypothetical protein
MSYQCLGYLAVFKCSSKSKRFASFEIEIKVKLKGNAYLS